MSAGGYAGGQPSSNSSSRAAYFEEFNDDANTAVPGTRQTANVAANVAAKRSKPEIRSLTVAEKVRDEAGNWKTSSPAGAVGSGDKQSSRESKPKLQPLKIPSPIEKSSGNPEKSTHNKSRSPEKPALRRRDSRGPNRENLRQVCESRESAARMRLSAEPVEKTFAPRPRRTGPPSPQTTRGPAPSQTQEEPVPQPARARPRPSVSQSRSRPVSYHAGMMQPPLIMYASQPPPSFVPQMSYPLQPLPQPTAAYLSTSLQTSPQRQQAYPFPPTTFDGYPRPPLQQHWTSDPYQLPSRRTSMHVVQPIVEYPEYEPVYAAVPTTHPPQTYVRRESIRRSERPSPLTPPEEQPQRAPRIEDYYEVPPATHKRTSSHSQLQQRPAMRHAATTTSAHPTLHHRRNTRDAVEIAHERPPRKPSLEEAHPTSRPTLTSRQPKLTSTDIHTSRSKPAAPSTGDSAAPSAPPAPTKQPRRRPVSYYGPRELERQAEEYQKAQIGDDRPNPITTDSIKQATRRRAKTQHSGGSEVGSRANSSREGSDIKKSKGSSSRTSSDKQRRPPNSDVRSKRHEPKEEFTFRVNGSQSVQLDIKGEMVEEKTINLRPSRDGQGTEISIGSRAASKMRESRPRDRSDRRYSIAGSAKSVREVGNGDPSGSRQRSRSRASPQEAVAPDGKEDSRVETGLLERLRKMRTSSRSRRSSRSGVSGRSVLEGQPF